VGQHAEVTLTFARYIGTPAQGRTEKSLVTRKSAFDLPALAVLAPVETPLHLPPVFRLGPLAAVATSVDRNYRRADPQTLAAEAVIFLAVEGGIAQDPVPGDNQGGFFHGRGKLRPIIAGTGADCGRGEEVAAGIADDRQLRPQTCGLLFAGAGKVVAGSVLAIQSRGIDGCLGLLVDQAAVLGAHRGGDEEKNGLPFFSSRWTALQRVE
jgi:hypothetical protein